MNNYFTCCCQHQTPGEEEKRQAEYQEAPQLHPVHYHSRSFILILQSHVESLVSSPGQGLLMCQTVRTTETPGRRPIAPVNFIHLCAAPGLIIKQILSNNKTGLFNSCIHFHWLQMVEKRMDNQSDHEV